MQRLGQHFLINKAAIQKIIAALDLQKEDTVIEIGPGKGALTMPLIEKCQSLNCKIIAIEKDPQLALSVERLGYSENLLETINADALKSLSETIKRHTLTAQSYKIVGNIPYYITGKLLRILSELEIKPKLIILTIQKEVAERIAAAPPKMNLLAAAVQIWARPEIIARLKSSDFQPPPKIDSAIIKITPLEIADSQLRIADYYKFINIAFKQPRKTLLNNLQAGLKIPPPLGTPFTKGRIIPKTEIERKLKDFNLTGQERPQNLSVEQLAKLSHKL